MAPSSSHPGSNKPTIKAITSNRRKHEKSPSRKTAVEVIVGGSAFPTEFQPSTHTPFIPYSQREKKKKKIEFTDAAREVHQLGSTMFTGSDKWRHKAAEYKRVTGRVLKPPKMPIKLVREKKKKEELKMKRQLALQKNGVVISSDGKKSTSEKKGYSVDTRRKKGLFGPAPSVGFMKKGMLHVKNDDDGY